MICRTLQYYSLSRQIGGRRAVGALNAFMRSHSSDHFEIISKTVPSPYRVIDLCVRIVT